MTVINHSTSYGGPNMMKLGIYVEFIYSMCWSPYWLIPIAIFEIIRKEICSEVYSSIAIRVVARQSFMYFGNPYSFSPHLPNIPNPPYTFLITINLNLFKAYEEVIILS